MTKKLKWANLYMVLVFIVLYAPIAFLILYSFNAGGDMNGFTGFTLEHYQALFEDTRLMTFILNTFILAILSALLATMIGTFGAIAIYFNKKKHQRQALLNFNNVLMVTPDVMMGASFLILFSILIPIKMGFWTVLIAHIAFNIPIVVLMVLPRLYEMNKTMLTAAQDLGANHGQIIRHIILPSIRSGIFAGFFMAFTFSLDDFAVTFFLAGNGFSTLAVEVYSRARSGISLEINALSALMFLLALGLVAGYYVIQMNEIKRQRKGGSS